jgi:hypothetical protein
VSAVDAPVTPIRSADDDCADARRRQRAEALRSLSVTVTDEWLTDPLPPREHLLTDRRTGLGAVDKTGTWLFAGAGGVGKSYAAADLTLAVGAGGSWYGLDTSGRPGRVLMIVAEDTADDIRRRINRIADRRYPDANIERRIVILPLRGRAFAFVQREQFTGSYLPGEGLRDVIAYVEVDRETSGSPIDLVIVDPAARISGVSLDKDSAAATAFIDALDRLSAAAGGLVLAVAHTNKTSRAADKGAAEATDVRGSSGLSDGARGVIHLVPEVDVRTKKRTGRAILSITKGNHVARWSDIVLLQGAGGVLEPLDEVDRAIWEAQRSKPAGDDKQAARDARALAQIAADARVVRQIMADGYTGRLRSAVQSRIGCGQPRADLAIARVRNEDARVPVSRGVSEGAREDTRTPAVSQREVVRETPHTPRHQDTGTPEVSGPGPLVSPRTRQGTEDTAGHRDDEQEDGRP